MTRIPTWILLTRPIFWWLAASSHHNALETRAPAVIKFDCGRTNPPVAVRAPIVFRRSTTPSPAQSIRKIRKNGVRKPWRLDSRTVSGTFPFVKPKWASRIPAKIYWWLDCGSCCLCLDLSILMMLCSVSFFPPAFYSFHAESDALLQAWKNRDFELTISHIINQVRDIGPGCLLDEDVYCCHLFLPSIHRVRTLPSFTELVSTRLFPWQNVFLRSLTKSRSSYIAWGTKAEPIGVLEPLDY